MERSIKPLNVIRVGNRIVEIRNIIMGVSNVAN
jgi:hypothetical protein